jgi:hypothetical protein
MSEITKDLERQVRDKIIQSLLALTIPSTWTPEVTLRYIISYIGKESTED